jgi:TolB protein
MLRGIIFGIGFLATASLSAASQQRPFVDINPSWSPDGRFLVFESWRHGDAELYLIAADGTREQRLTWTGGSDTHPSWSPDGLEILFDSDRDGAWNL